MLCIQRRLTGARLEQIVREIVTQALRRVWNSSRALLIIESAFNIFDIFCGSCTGPLAIMP